MNSIRFIGCCGAYCKTCKPFIEGYYKGCKLGYDSKERDIKKARCNIKLCCLEKNFETCADCLRLESCEILCKWYSKKGYKYKKYKESVEFIKKNGYDKFTKEADNWKGAYGRLE